MVSRSMGLWTVPLPSVVPSRGQVPSLWAAVWSDCGQCLQVIPLSVRWRQKASCQHHAEQGCPALFSHAQPSSVPYLSQLVLEAGAGFWGWQVSCSQWVLASAVVSVPLWVEGWLFKERRGGCGPSSPERLLHS